MAERPIALPPVRQQKGARYADQPIPQRRGLRLRDEAHSRRCPRTSCIALRVGDCADDVKQAIADKIIALAKKTGERNPDVLCEQAVKGIRSAPPPIDVATPSAPPRATAPGPAARDLVPS